MLFMVIERFRNGDVRAVRDRFEKQGRMMPDGVEYIASWIDAKRARCYQVMQSPSPELLNQWIECWRDLVDFEVVPIETSAEFWARFTGS